MKPQTDLLGLAKTLRVRAQTDRSLTPEQRARFLALASRGETAAIGMARRNASRQQTTPAAGLRQTKGKPAEV